MMHEGERATYDYTRSVFQELYGFPLYEDKPNGTCCNLCRSIFLVAATSLGNKRRLFQTFWKNITQPGGTVCDAISEWSRGPRKKLVVDMGGGRVCVGSRFHLVRYYGAPVISPIVGRGRRWH